MIEAPDYLVKELKKVSENKWFGLPYGSFHHVDFMYSGSKFGHNPVVQRDTAERFANIGITREMINGKKVIDLGCNTGSMLTFAKQLGASWTYGIDNDKPAINFAKKLYEYLGYEGKFVCGDINALSFIPSCDVLFCFAISKWVEYDHLIKILSESNVPIIVFEDNKHFGKIIPDIIPGYDCEFKWFSGPEANTDKGWGRVNYMCRKK